MPFPKRCYYKSSNSNRTWSGSDGFPLRDDQCEKQVILIDQPCSKGVGNQLGNANENIMLDSLFQLSNDRRIEVSLQLSLASGDSLQCFGNIRFFPLIEIASTNRVN